MKIAHLILAHKNPLQLLMLIEALNHPDCGIFIHIDRKTNIQPFKSIINGRNIFFLQKRVKIYWGDYGTIQATLNGFDAILTEKYDYINVISGQDFPIKPAEYIYQFFLKRMGQEFITCHPIAGKWADVASRVNCYHFVNWRVPGKYRISKLFTRFFPERVFPLPYEIVGRANWFSLTKEAVQYSLSFLKQHPEVIRYFKYCWGADEFIFSTILFNSGFKEKIQDNLLYVDWNSTEIGHPRVLTHLDYDSLCGSSKLFARKFDIKVDPTILALLQEERNIDYK